MDCRTDCLRGLANYIGIKTIGDEGSWENLPKDLMEKIALNLNSTDYIHSSMVCKSWQSLLLRSNILMPQLLWLLLPHRSRKHIIKFYNVLENKFHKFRLPRGVDGGEIVGCSKGWVIFMAVGSKVVSLFNPVSGVKCLLPSLQTALSLQRLELSSSNANSDCIVAAIVGNGKKLAFCRPGDEIWEFVSILSGGFGQDNSLVDIMFCCQKLYVLVNTTTVNGKLENIPIKLPNYAISVALIPDVNYDESNTLLENEDHTKPWVEVDLISRNNHVSYLVESIKGQPLVIQKYIKTWYIREDEEVNVPDDDGDETEEEANDVGWKQAWSNLDGFKVYEVEDLAREERIPKDLGNEQELFLSSKSRLCLPTTPNELRGNCVNYIVEHEIMTYFPLIFSPGINGGYHLRNFTTHAPIFKHMFHWNPKLMWFAPNFQH